MQGLPQVRLAVPTSQNSVHFSSLSKSLSLSLLTNPSSSAPLLLLHLLLFSLKTHFCTLNLLNSSLPSALFDISFVWQGLPPPLTSADLHLASSCSSFKFHLLSVWRWNPPTVSRALDSRARPVCSDTRVDDEYINRNNWIRSGGWNTYQSRAVKRQSAHSKSSFWRVC